jgi:branched-chain amino acid transport system substrate-binding protein
VLLANDAGFIDSRFVQEVGPQVQGVLTRDVWGNDVAAAKAGLKKINDMYRPRPART